MIGATRAFLRAVTRAGAAALVRRPRRAAAEPPPETTRLETAPMAQPRASGAAVSSPRISCGSRDSPTSSTSRLRTGAAPSGTGRPARRTSTAHVTRRRSSCGSMPATPIVILARAPRRLLRAVRDTSASRPIRDLKGKTRRRPGARIRPARLRRDAWWPTSASIRASDVELVAAMPPAEGDPAASPRARSTPFWASARCRRSCAAGTIGHVVVNSTVDRPWSQYFCCMVAGNRDFVRKHPVATKRALRALLEGRPTICALEPERGRARTVVDRGGSRRERTTTRCRH